MLEMKNIVTEMKDSCDGFISILGTAKVRISELGDMSVETSQNEVRGENQYDFVFKKGEGS